jgi:hypothetical protein
VAQPATGTVSRSPGDGWSTRLAPAALSRADEQLDDPRTRKAAAQLHEVMKLEVSPDGELRHLHGSAVPAGPADFAAFALGCREFARMAQRKDADALAIKLLAAAGGR